MKRVLIADDSASFLSSLWMILTDVKNLDVVLAYNADEILRIHQLGGPFDNIITDIRMPGMDGIEAINRIPVNSNEKITFMSACEETHYQDRISSLLEKGYNITGVLRKPFSYKKVLEVLD